MTQRISQAYTNALNAITAFFVLLQKLISDATTDSKTGRFLPDKAGAVIAGMAWTFFMVYKLPESEMMWLSYFGAVAGWAEVRRRAAGPLNKEEQKPNITDIP